MQCIACLSSQTTPLYRDLNKCLQCGHVFYVGSLSIDDIKKIYSPAYFKGEEYVDYQGDKEILVKNFSSRLDTLLEFVANSKDKKLLEIGSAYGYFLELASKYFQEVEGLEVSREAAEYAKTHYSFKTTEGSMEDMNYTASTYDVVCLWDTIEHLSSPDQALKKISKILRPDGLVALTTGDISSFNARIRGKDWRLIHPPSHVHYFTQKSIRILLDRLGFEVIYSKSPGYYRSLELILHKLLIDTWRIPKCYNVLKRMGLTRLGIYINFFDIMFVIARKKANS